MTPAVSATVLDAQSGAAQSATADKDKDRYKDKAAKVKEKLARKIDQKDREAAAARALQDGAVNPLMTGIVPLRLLIDNGVPVPRYFSHPTTPTARCRR